MLESHNDLTRATEQLHAVELSLAEAGRMNTRLQSELANARAQVTTLEEGNRLLTSQVADMNLKLASPGLPPPPVAFSALPPPTLPADNSPQPTTPSVSLSAYLNGSLPDSWLLGAEDVTAKEVLPLVAQGEGRFVFAGTVDGVEVQKTLTFENGKLDQLSLSLPYADDTVARVRRVLDAYGSYALFDGRDSWFGRNGIATVAGLNTDEGRILVTLQPNFLQSQPIGVKVRQ